MKCADYLRLNYSSPDITCFEQFRVALPLAIAEAQAGRYATAGDAFFAPADTDRGPKIRAQIGKRRSNVAAQ